MHCLSLWGEAESGACRAGEKGRSIYLFPHFLHPFLGRSGHDTGVFFAQFCPRKIKDHMGFISANMDKLRSTMGSQLWGNIRRMYGLSHCEIGRSGASIWVYDFGAILGFISVLMFVLARFDKFSNNFYSTDPMVRKIDMICVKSISNHIDHTSSDL